MSTTITQIGYNGGPPTSYVLCNGNAYGQTLFLGCTVKGYNNSLGWGEEASRLEVDLIEDTCSYPVLTDINGNTVTRPSINSSNDYINSRLNNSFPVDNNGHFLVPGKVYYQPEDNGLVSKYYYDADPGFYGVDKYNSDGVLIKPAIDLMGVAVYFKHDNFEFYGIIQNWTNDGGRDGTRTYKVIIQSPSNLVNNTQMILGNYHGTIFRRDPEDTHGFPGYVRRSDEIYGGTIAQQNIPNVINVYGYLEQNGFGNSGRNEEGIPSLNIINAIHYLLSSSSPDNSIYKFSPFGRILGRCPTYENNGLVIDSSYTMGIIHPILDSSNIHRSMYYIDLTSLLDSEAISLLKYSRISATSMSIQEFVNQICPSIGRQFYFALEIGVLDGVIIPKITLKTISTLVQTRDGVINDFISYAASLGTTVSQYNKGKSYNSSSPVRTMLIGGKQQRLYQVKNTKYAVKQSTLRYNPLADATSGGKFIFVDHYTKNYYRIPDINSVRNPYLDYNNSSRSYYGRVEVPNTTEFDQTDNLWDNVSFATKRGNYKYTEELPTGFLGFIQTNDDDDLFVASDYDAICPYFGKNNITNSIRKVYSRPTGFVVHFTNTEIGLAIGYSFSTNQDVLVNESEIRAAMVGVDSYAGFISAVINDGGEDKLDIFSKVIKPIIGTIPFNVMVQGINSNYNKYNNSRGGNSSIPTGANAGFNSYSVLNDLLKKLQQFFGDIGHEYYGKKFMVNVPTPEYWTDSRPFEPAIPIGIDGKVLLDGTQQTYFSFEPTDFAWEEPGNVIDDSLMVGSIAMDVFTDDNGGITPIVGYNNTYQLNYQKAFMQSWWFNTAIVNPEAQSLFNFWKFDALVKTGLSINGSQSLSNFYEPSLFVTPDKEQISVIKPYTIQDAYGISNVQASKLYTKATVEKTLEVYVPSYNPNVITAKAIVTVDGINLNPMYDEALNVNVAAVEFLARTYTGNSSSVASKILSLMPLYNLNQQVSPFGQDTAGKQYDNINMAPKAAIPAFVSIPIMFNNAVYGPWISSPDMAANSIFTDNHMTRLENLVGGVKVEINEGLVPWSYGGMRVLDEAALQLAGAENNYNITQEEGSLVTYGLPLRSLGQELLSGGPLVTNIQIQIGENGPITTYTLRTFTKKFALFNKENAERLSKNSQNTIRLNRNFNQKIRDVTNKMLSLGNNPLSNNTYKTSKLNQYSPMAVLVGHSSPYVSPKFSGVFFNGKEIPPSKYLPGTWTKDSVMQNTVVTLQDSRELPQEYNSNYASKSFMSLDGLFVPVSFFPTAGNNNAYFSKYKTSNCPACNATKYYKVDGVNTYCEYCDPNIGNVANTGIGGNNLNPIVTPIGFFRNYYARNDDYNTHNIDMVGRSLVPMAGSLSYKENLATNQNGYEYYDYNSNIDYNNALFETSNNLESFPNGYLMNYRFMALRGPLVVNGWGFDTDGYPVPNISGDPKFVNASGFPLKIANRFDSVGSYDPAYAGTILGQNQVWTGNNGWSNPVREYKFAKGWALRPDTWPVGPVDLRWNPNTKTWGLGNTKEITVITNITLTPTGLIFDTAKIHISSTGENSRISIKGLGC